MAFAPQHMTGRPLYASPAANRQDQYARLLLKEGVDTSPTDMWGGLARIGTAGIGGLMANQAGEKEKAYAAALSGALQSPDPIAALRANPELASQFGSTIVQSGLEDKRYQQQRQDKQADTEAERGFRKEMFGMERQGRMEDQYTGQQFQRELAQINQAFQSGQMTAQQAFQASENAKNRDQQMKAAELNRVPAGFTAANGAMTPIPGGPADPAYLGQKTEATTGAKMNDEQAKAAGFADRIRTALPIIEQFSEAGTSPLNRALAGIPVAGNYLVGPEYQQLDQAKRNFVNAILRRESGAVISDSEFSNADKQYFPQPGDGPAVLAQKQKNREEAISGMTRSAGPAYKPPKEAGGWKIELVK